VSLYTHLLSVYAGGHHKIRFSQGHLDGYETHFTLSSFSRRWLRPGSLTQRLGGKYSLNLKRNKKKLILISILAVIVLAIFIVTGCVKGLSPIGWSGVAYSNGVIFTGSKEGRLVSVDLASNNARKFADPIKVTGGGGGCGGGSPAVAIYGTPVFANIPVLGQLVFIAGYNGKVYAYAADTLQSRWVYPTEGNLGPIVSGVLISDNVLYVGDADGNVYALDAATGALKWKAVTGGEIWSSPSIDGTTLFVSSFDKKVYAFDTATGAKKWDYATSSTNVAAPIIVNGTVYVGSLDRNIYALNEINGELKWKFSGDNWFWARPVELNGVIYAPNLDNKVYALDAVTGAKLVAFDLAAQIASSPVIVNNQVIVSTRDGKLWSLDTNKANFGQGGNKKIITSLPLGIEVDSPLSFNGDNVYINASDNNVYIVNVTQGTLSSPVSLKSQ
jgi:outer membrane protein assembly factor BamB